MLTAGCGSMGSAQGQHKQWEGETHTKMSKQKYIAPEPATYLDNKLTEGD